MYLFHTQTHLMHTHTHTHIHTPHTCVEGSTALCIEATAKARASSMPSKWSRRSDRIAQTSGGSATSFSRSIRIHTPTLWNWLTGLRREESTSLSRSCKPHCTCIAPQYVIALYTIYTLKWCQYNMPHYPTSVHASKGHCLQGNRTHLILPLHNKRSASC